MNSSKSYQTLNKYRTISKPDKFWMMMSLTNTSMRNFSMLTIQKMFGTGSLQNFTLFLTISTFQTFIFPKIFTERKLDA